jgi:hypothetical protein
MRHKIIGFAALMSGLTIASISSAEGVNITVLDESLSALGTTVTTVQSSVTTNRNRVGSAETDIDVLRNNVTAAESNAKSLKSRVNTAEGTLTTLGSSVSSIDGRINTVEGTLTTLGSSVSSIGSRVNTLEAASGGVNLLTIAVDCASESLNDAIIDAPAAKHLIVNITGTCSEEVIITRSGISLVGPATIEFADTLTNSFHGSIDPDGDLLYKNSTVSITGAQNVVIDNLTISGASDEFGSFGAGIYIGSGSSALITDSTLQGNRIGLVARFNSTAVLKGNTIANTEHGVWAIDGSSVFFTGDNTITQAAGAGSSSAAVGVYRNGNVFFIGANTITSDALGLEVYHGSQVRSARGLLTVEAASSNVGLNSQIDFRDVAHTGDLKINDKGTLRLANHFTTYVGVSVTGNINVNGVFALFTANGGTTVTGDVNCANPTSIARANGSVTGTVSTFCN